MALDRSLLRVAAPVAMLMLSPSAVLAQRPDRPAGAPAERTSTTTTTEPAAPARTRDGALPPDSTTESSVTISGKPIAYTAVAGLLAVGATDPQDAMLGLDGRYLPDSGMDLPAKPEDRPATANIFYTAYFAKGSDTLTRPITFVYNGGPGSATMYLRMTSFGPMRVQIPDLDHPAGGPYKLASNPECLLDATDLVFIDAPGTGYSRVLGKNAGAAFYGVDEDAAAFDRFIRRFLSKYDRWKSPKFLFGESYGTTRNAVLAAALQRSNVDLNGVIFLSQILSFPNSADSSDSTPGSENGYFLGLPSMAATAWFHHRVPNLDAAKKQAVAAKLESYTGIPATLWTKANLRMTGGQFSKFVQEASGLATGRLDSRYDGPDQNPFGERTSYDPFGSATTAYILAGQVTYAHETLHWGDGMTYKPSAREPGNYRWNMARSGGRRGGGGSESTGTTVMPDLASTMTQNPKMHVLLMGGYFDLGTLYFGAEYEMKHLPMDASLEKNIDYKFFETGHMVYLNEAARKGLHDKTAAFIEQWKNAQ
jgi:carboxypeptidase C (cathepsin A)